MRTVVTGLLVAATLAGCRAATEAPGVSRAALRPIGTCDELGAMLRRAAVEEMREQVLANYRAALEEPGYCGHGWDEEGDYDGSAGADADADADGDIDGDPSDEGASEYSTTNLQEAGVDEADFIKNDGSYIYIVAGTELIIIDAWPAETTAILSRVDLGGRPTALYVHADRAIVYSEVATEGAGAGGSDCYVDEYRGEWVCGASRQGTMISVFDVTDRAAPRLEREIVASGLYVNSRRIGDAVHTVMSYPEVAFPSLPTWPESVDLCTPTEPPVLYRAFMDLIDENERAIMETPLDGFVPTMSDTQYGPDGSATTDDDLLGDCRGFYEATDAAGRSFLSVVSFDPTEPGSAVNVTSIVGDQGVVYASPEALYVASRQGRGAGGSWYFPEGDGVDEATTLHRFSFSQSSAETFYDSSGVVPGRIVNQFAMSEHRGFFRIATTVGYLPSPDCSNNVYVLGPRDGLLEVVGSVTGIAPSEDIRSVRFTGDRGFVVTFKKTDPLFALDLSDPTHPRIAGELHIPGFSTYMHLMDEDHLLAIGFDAQDEGDFAWFQGVQLQIFDVSDMSRPERIHLEVIGTRGTSSEATANHLAFNYFAPRDLLAIPMAICEDGHDGTYGDLMSFNGLLVYDVTVEDGFHEHGRVSHMGSTEPTTGCGSWWTDPSSAVKRSVIMDDYVYSVASDEIIVASLDDLSTPLARVALPFTSESGGGYDY